LAISSSARPARVRGIALAVTDEDIAAHMRLAGQHEGMLVCPEGGAALAATARLRGDGWNQGR